MTDGNHYLVASELRDCDPAGTRSATDTVVVFSTIHTAHSGDVARFCTGLDCGSSRHVTTTPPAAAWATVEDEGYRPFIVIAGRWSGMPIPQPIGAAIDDAVSGDAADLLALSASLHANSELCSQEVKAAAWIAELVGSRASAP